MAIGRTRGVTFNEVIIMNGTERVIYVPWAIGEDDDEGPEVGGIAPVIEGGGTFFAGWGR